METANALATQAFESGTPLAVTATPAAGTLPAVSVTPGTPGPTATKRLPQGGFFDDVAAGRASPNSLAVVGFAALVLVGIIVAARRLRRA
jgi:hypothetical protein